MSKRPVAVVIADDADVRELLVTVLGMSGCVVHATANGVSGIGSVRVYRPDIIILDLDLGLGLRGGDSVEVAHRIRLVSGAYILVLTTHPRVITALKRVSSMGFMLKPFLVDELRTRVQTALKIAGEPEA